LGCDFLKGAALGSRRDTAVHLRERLVLGALGIVCGVVIWIGIAGHAAALQFTPDGTARLHFNTDGQPGTTWNTGGLAVNGQVQYRSLDEAVDPGLLTLEGRIDVLNYFDPNDPTCAANTTNCNFDFNSDLMLSVEAQFADLVVVPVSGTIVDITMKFESTADGNADLVWSDPNFGNASVMESDWSAGTFQGNPTTGLEARVFFDTGSGTSLGSPSVVGLSLVDLGSPYASLFDNGGSAHSAVLDLSSFFDFSPVLDSIILQTLDPNNTNNVVPSFTSEGQGQVFRLPEGDFVPVPEPSTLLLLGAALAGLASLRRRGEI
jgi:hypothetical protein